MKRYGIDLHIIGPLCGEFTAVLEKLLNKQSKYLWFKNVLPRTCQCNLQIWYVFHKW